ncbi:L,D-transpeptidase family protein [Sphingobium sufflavum]|nr:L,D-transpeptidase family protein [Sphingobium sufflavum]MCE7797253.1 L,D-transpeptidase family protein [Sphingobium sufflavum]
MRKILIVVSLLTSSLALTACDMGMTDRATTAPGQPEWNDANTRDLNAIIARCAEHSLNHLNFEEKATDPAALTRMALRYANALSRGATDPAKLYEIYTVARPAPDLRRGLADALASGKLSEWLDSLAPQTDSYRTLSEAYRKLINGDGAPSTAIPALTDPLKPGASDPRIPAIARQLVASDYLDARQAQGDRYSDAMVEAVKHMQVDYGIDPDGEIGPEAFAILNLSDSDRARAIAVAMERLRWLDRTPPGTRIDVNVAAARLDYWRDGKIVDSRKVIVGEPETEPPQLGSPIFRLVANPTWTVPVSIEKKEIAGKDDGYLTLNNMTRKNGRIVQLPGPKNSLGLVKFDMTNEHQIYLHDTPAKTVFAEVQRQRSHGCVRVDDALGFAEMLASDAGILDQWHKARATGKETFVHLPREIPVRLLYRTVIFDGDGQPIVRADPYGWNDRVSVALGFPAGRGSRIKAAGGDIGP